MGFLGLLTDGGQKGPPLSLKSCLTYPTMMKLGTVIPYLKDPKNMSHVTHPLSSAAPKISKFCYIRNTCIDCILIQKF